MTQYQPKQQQDNSNPIEKLNIYEIEQELKFVREQIVVERGSREQFQVQTS